MTLTISGAFSKFLSDLTPTEAQRTAAAGHRASINNAIRSQIPIKYIEETGSFRHGTGVRNYSDVDILVSMSRARPGSSETALAWIRDALTYRFPRTPVKVRRPAVVVEFANKNERWEVIPGFLTELSSGVLDYYIPGAPSGWIISAPGEHLEYVNECNSQDGTAGGAKKLARLVKAWKYFNSVPISSFYLEMRAAQHVKGERSFLPVWDICQLLEKLDRHQLAPMNDPKKVAGRFNACSSEVTREIALSKLRTASSRARKALDAHRNDDDSAAFHYLSLLFDGEFPHR